MRGETYERGEMSQWNYFKKMMEGPLSEVVSSNSLSPNSTFEPKSDSNQFKDPPAAPPSHSLSTHIVHGIDV